MTKLELVALVVKLLGNMEMQDSPISRKVHKEEDIKTKIKDIRNQYSFSELRTITLSVSPDLFIPETLTRARLVGKSVK